MKIVITGATGLIGQSLGPALINLGHELICISRDIRKAQNISAFPCQWIEIDLNKESLSEAPLCDVDIVFHLAGENIAGSRWNQNYKQRLSQSRIQSSKNLLQSFKNPPGLVVSASAVGIYGTKKIQGEVLETQDTADDFLAQLCGQWEHVFHKQATLWKQTRFVQARLGVVLSEKGGALTKMLPAFRFNLGGALGDGQQIMSWIHIEDLVQAFLHIMRTQDIHSAVNLVAPQPVSNLDFTRSLNQHLGKWNAPAVPAFLLKLLLGEMSQILLTGVPVSSQKLQQSGFQFRYSDIDTALSDLVSKMRL